MAEIISKVSKKIKNAANVTVKKTKSAANIAKLTVQVKALESELKACFEKLGAALFRQVKLDEDNDELIASRIVEAQELQSEIDELKAQIKQEKAELKRKKEEAVEAEFAEVDAEDDSCDEPCSEEQQTE